MSKKVTIDGAIYDAPTALQERFFNCYLENNFENAQDAARKAGVKFKDNASLRANASALCKVPWVAANIAYHKKKAREVLVEHTALTREEIIIKMRNIFEAAMAEGKYEAAWKAAHSLGTEIDMFTVKSERTEKRFNISTDTPEIQNKIARIAALLKGDYRSDDKIDEDSDILETTAIEIKE